MAIILSVGLPLLADDAETMGLTAMRRERPSIVGTGIPVAQPEGGDGTSWEADPGLNAGIFFTWTSALGRATNYPNSVGAFSSHAQGVGINFYSAFAGFAPGVPRVDSYEALYFITNKIILRKPIAAQVVNQSFIVDEVPVDPFYDAFAATYNVLFVSGMNNTTDTPHEPGTCYNGIGVGFISATAQSSVGPTTDGRAKPDLVAPHFCCSSFSTPYVAGAAALLLQAGAQNDGGANTASVATNSITTKALLLNGAVKMTNWTNGATRPLDARYGAGVLNVYNSDLQLRGGRHVASATNSVILNLAHPPGNFTNAITSLRGWDHNTIHIAISNDTVTHYYFDLPTNAADFSLTTTLVWQKGTGVLANLDLFLYDAASNQLVTNSVSTLDNVEHIFIPRLPAGRYDLQVLKHGGPIESSSENYALAFAFAPTQIFINRSGTNVVVAWPASPAGFVLQAAPSLDLPLAWQDVLTTSVLSNAMNTVTLPASPALQVFRLFRP